jgi:hypothetical protein
LLILIKPIILIRFLSKTIAKVQIIINLKGDCMKTLCNILWHIPCCGFIGAIAVYLLGLILTATVVAAPIGLGLMQYGKFLFAPFGRAMISN